jgi:glutamyl endopeptidase
LALVAGAGAFAVAAPADASADASGAGGASGGPRVAAGQHPAADLGGKTFTKGFAGADTRLTPESVIGADGRTQVTDTTEFPARAIGQILVLQGGQAFTCTGWLIDKNSILTSGHCSFTPDGAQGDVIDWATFSPGQNGADQPYGSCSVYEVMAPLAWRRDGSEKNDWSVMQLGDGASTCDAGTTTGWFGISWTKGARALTGVGATVQGYPGDKAYGTQWTMSGTIKRSTKQMVYYRMDTAGGQSGSPVFDPTGAKCGGTPCGMAVHSYGLGFSGASARNNSGPRITQSRFTTITNYAAENG